MDQAAYERRKARMGDARIEQAQSVGVVVVIVSSVAAHAWNYVSPGPWRWFWGVLSLTGLFIAVGVFVILYRAGRP